MLLHGSCISFSVNILLVEIVHYESKCTGHIVNCQSCLVMADSERLNPDRTFFNRHSNSSNNLATTNVSVQPEVSQTYVSAGDAALLKKKPTSFQITSVTVQGSRLSTDGGDDSADDLDESHTDDLSSDVLDCSRTTDVDNDPLSEDNSNTTNNSVNPSTTIPVRSTLDRPIDVPVQPRSVASIATVPTDLTPKPPETQSDSITKAPTIPDQWQHRFKVVKIVSSQPFKRGRWLCMDFLDPPTVHASEAKPETPDSVAAGSSGSLTEACGSQTINSVAHVYEINPNDSYPGGVSVSVRPEPVQQPLYGIVLPLNNQQFPEMAAMPAVFAQDQVQFVDSTTQKSQCFGNQTMQSQAQPNLVTPAVPQQQNYVATSNAYEETATPMQTFVSSSQPPVITSVPSPQIPMQASHSGQQQAPVTPAENIPMQVTQSQMIPNSQVTQSQMITSRQTPTVVSSTSTSQQTVQEPMISLTLASQVQPPSQGVPSSQNLPQQQQQQQHSVCPSSTVHVTSQVSSTLPVPGATTKPASSVGIQASGQPSIPDVGPSVVQQPASTEVYTAPSQAPQNHVDSSGQPLAEALPESLTQKTTTVEESENTPSGSNTVAIDNKIEQAMDLVKSHLMFAVREEVDVLKEKITELMERISLLEYENSFLRSNATQETLSQLNQSQQLQQQQQHQQQQQQQQQQQTQSAAAVPAHLQQNIQSQQQQPTL